MGQESLLSLEGTMEVILELETRSKNAEAAVLQQHNEAHNLR